MAIVAVETNGSGTRMLGGLHTGNLHIEVLHEELLPLFLLRETIGAGAIQA